MLFLSGPLYSVKFGIFASVADVCSFLYSGINHKILESFHFNGDFLHYSVSLTCTYI